MVDAPTYSGYTGWFFLSKGIEAHELASLHAGVCMCAQVVMIALTLAMRLNEPLAAALITSFTSDDR